MSTGWSDIAGFEFGVPAAAEAGLAARVNALFLQDVVSALEKPSVAQKQAGTGPLAASEQIGQRGGADKISSPQVQDRSVFQVEHDQLDGLAAKNIVKEKDLKRFRQDMIAFEDRALRSGLDKTEVGGTYNQIARLLNNTGDQPIKQEDKLKIAQQILDQAARPDTIDQGLHQTCSVTVVESRIYTRNPSAAARLVADVATTGQFQTADGSRISIDAKSLVADEEARQHPNPDRLRSYASQLFQIAAVNVHWQRQTHTPSGSVVARGAIHYEQHQDLRGPWDRGERLIDYSGPVPREIGKQPQLGVGHLTDISNQITGLHESGFTLENRRRGGMNSIYVSSEQELKDEILKARASGNLPVILRVHTGNDPFDSGTAASSSASAGVWHVVTITEIDEQNGKVKLNNSWGTSSDRWVKLKTLYRATLDPTDKMMLQPFNIPRWDKVILGGS